MGFGDMDILNKVFAILAIVIVIYGVLVMLLVMVLGLGRKSRYMKVFGGVCMGLVILFCLLFLNFLALLIRSAFI